MGSDSDLAVIARRPGFSEEFGVASEITVASAHRSPARIERYAASVDARGIQVPDRGSGRRRAPRRSSRRADDGPGHRRSAGVFAARGVRRAARVGADAAGSPGGRDVRRPVGARNAPFSRSRSSRPGSRAQEEARRSQEENGRGSRTKGGEGRERELTPPRETSTRRSCSEARVG